jgi:hypothetical protein
MVSCRTQVQNTAPKGPRYIKPEILDKIELDIDRDEWNKAMLEVAKEQAEYMEKERTAYNEIKDDLIGGDDGTNS